jgi:circadian clock protein KaiB
MYLSLELEKIVLKLYVSGRAPNSQRARSNLDEILEQNRPERFDLEIIDILENPMRAIKDGILVTPTLCKIAPLPRVEILGNLSDMEKVIQSLGLIGGRY